MYSEILILAMLRRGKRHGYEIKKDIDRALGGMVALNNKTLYLALKRFEGRGAVKREVILQEGKPNRHLYELTERGIEMLQALLRDFGPEQAGSEAEFFTRVSFFDFLDIPERQVILRERLGYLQKALEYLRSLQRWAEDGEECTDIVPTQTHAERVLAFHTRRIRDEYAWIASWLEELQAES
ncbi:MAG: PadR family transcriptional regulator [Ktedonobacteraceae bacterium]|nr:PadR family transcriptional regulator [Ktedonobacteraceae bacterium]